MKNRTLKFLMNSAIRGLTALTVVLALLAATGTQTVLAATITVNTTADEFNTGASCSLREAIQAANTDAAFGGCAAGSGADTINLPAGTYTLTLTGIEDANAAGDLDVGSSIAINGAGAGSTIIDGNNADRIFDVFPSSAITFGLSNVTVRNGRTPSTGFNVGGAVYLHNNVTATISNSTFSGNTATTSGGAIESRGVLTVTNSTFSSNTSGALGGAINASSTTATLSVTGSSFSGNQAEAGGALNIATNAGNSSSITTSLFQNNHTVLVAGGVDENGGALRIDTDGNVSITKSTFTGNTANVNGGAIYFNDNATQASAPTLTANFNRIVGNTAVSGNGLYGGSASGVVSIENNWWGCNAGPSTAPCDRVAGINAADFNPWLKLSLTANPTSVDTGGTSALTASFLTNSDNINVGASNLSALIGVPVTFGATLGTISNADATIQSSGTAAAMYTAGLAAGTGSATATVDGQQVSVNITINSPTPTPTDTPTNTPVIPTNTPTDTPTSTPVIPTNTPTDTPTSTPVIPTNTPTDTPTSTPVIPTNTPTDTPTSTPVIPTDTPTSTPTSTNTPTNTPTPTPVNQPPSATVTGGQCSVTNTVSGKITFTLADPDGDSLSLVFVSNSNTDLVQNSKIVLGGTGNVRTLTVTAIAKKSGTAVLTFNLSDGTVTVPVVVTVIVGTDANEILNGGSGIDMIFGRNGSNTINGDAGNDLLCGGNSIDTLNGGDGNDFLGGQNGDDILRGELGDDTLKGNKGADSFSGGAGTDIAADFTPSQGDTQDGTIP